MGQVTPAGAIFSEDKKYRYVLWRIMNSALPMVQYIGLNPSTANENTNDATIKKLIKITHNNGYGGFYMTNLFALVSRFPALLVNHPDPLKHNDLHLKVISNKVGKVIFCWGDFKQAYSTGRADQVMSMFPDAYCIRRSTKGRPWHPLFCYDIEKFIKF